jgi:hypothetical protein
MGFLLKQGAAQCWWRQYSRRVPGLQCIFTQSVKGHESRLLFPVESLSAPVIACALKSTLLSESAVLVSQSSLELPSLKEE